jgi:hypothetical protein
MVKRSPRSQKGQARVQELVVVAFADDMEQARDYETLLKNNDIPAIIREQRDDSSDKERVAVLVPEESVDEAHVVIESQDAYDDFYDFALDEQDDSDLGAEFFDDDF